MAWVKLDDQAPRNAKLLKAGPAAAWMWVCGLAYCQAHTTGGFIPTVAVPMLGIRGSERSHRLVKVLVKCRLFDRKVGGFVVHDYLEFNESREEAIARKAELSAKRAASGRKGGLAKVANAKQTVVANPSPDPTRPDLNKNPLPPKGGRITRDDKKLAKEIRRQRFGHCHHDPPCEDGRQCEYVIAAGIAAKRAS